FDVATLNYYSLGGLVYAGDYPLNNPDNQGDVGIASLYRLVNDQIVFVEDQTFQEYGYFWFGYLFPGDYMVKVGLTPESPSYNEYFTTYYGDEVSWTKADILSVSSVSQFDAEVHLAPVQELSSGAGTIKGYVKFEQGNQYNMPPIAQTNVILADKNHVPLLFTHPNAAGYFEFSSLPVDSYYLSADATGKPSSTVLVTLTQAVPVVEGINLTVFGSNISFIPDETSGNQLMIKLFPNPAGDNLYISMYSVYSDPIEVTICDITGKIQHRSSVVFEPGTNTWVIPVNNLPAGIYLLRIQQPGILQPITARFIK
ncbi:MAG TPA: T9SS type A sorting domain-containing protein, partial [Bacteroidales bacterium]|nr:T9SS type A sorting domain-containing protein [Bacteroidales bacterium]